VGTATRVLQDKVAIITGGGHGIGATYCRAFAAAGAAVVVAEIDAPAAERVTAELRAKDYRALAVPTDVADERSTREMAAQVLDTFGRIDVLLNNAAVFHTVPISRVGIEEISPEEWDRVMVVNLKGLFHCCRAVLPEMRRQGKGKIINISSGTALSGSPTRIHYVTSKAGVIGFTRCLAREVGGSGICVNAIAPGSTLSEENPTPEIVRFREQRVKDRAIPRMQRPEDLVGAAIYLASDASDFVTGQTLVVDGGGVMT
jgi:3-oxoacyl-[acyl-carrier protein] reductase